MKSLALPLVLMFVGALGSGGPFDRNSCGDFRPNNFPDMEVDGTSPLVIEVDPKTVKAGQPITIHLYLTNRERFLNAFLTTYCKSCLDRAEYIGTFEETSTRLMLIDCNDNNASAVSRYLSSKIYGFTLKWVSDPSFTGKLNFVGTMVYNSTAFYLGAESEIVKVESEKK